MTLLEGTPISDQYIDWLAEALGFPEVGKLFVQSGFDCRSRPLWLRTAYMIARGNTTYDATVTQSEGAIEDEERHHGPDVMNLVGLVQGLKDNREIIESGSTAILDQLEEAKQAMGSLSEDLANLSADDLFRRMIRVPTTK